MLYWTMQWVVISLVLIMLIHYLYAFFKNTLTVPKIKDLVNKPNERYNEILETLKLNKNTEIVTETVSKTEMQQELRSFLKDIKKSPNNTEKKQVMAANDGVGAFSSY